MKNKILIILILLNISSAFSQMKAYKYVSKIETPSSIWHKIKLEESVFNKIKSDYSDLRIFQISGKDTIESPYFIQDYSNEVTEQISTFEILNSSKKDGFFYYTLKRKTSEEIKQINLDFARSNFDWKVTLEGSNSQNEWFELTKDQRIVSIENEETDYSYTKLTFPTSSYKFFRIKIKEENSPELTFARFSNIQKNNLEKIKHSKFDVFQDKEQKRTIISAQFDSKIPLSSIKLLTESKYDFNRRLSFFVSLDSIFLDDYENRNEIYSGNLTSFEENTFDFEQTFVRYVKIVIENNDNQAIDIKGVEFARNPINLIGRFEAQGNYFLCFGNEEADFPNYDIEQFADKIPKNISELKYEIFTEIPEEIDNKKTEQANKTWLWLIVGFVVLLLVYFTVKMMGVKSKEE